MSSLTAKFPAKKQQQQQEQTSSCPPSRKAPDKVVEVMNRFEADLTIHQSDNPKDNIIALISKSECTIDSQLLLIGGIPDNDRWPHDKILAWILDIAETFKNHANGKPIPVQLNILMIPPKYILFPDGNTFSVKIPIERQQFHLGGSNNTLLEPGFGILDRADDPFPSTSQALTTTNPRDLLTLVELCTMRGIPDHTAEAQVILAILHHKISSVFSPPEQAPAQ